MIVVLECPAAAHGDEPRIADLGQDHRVACLTAWWGENGPATAGAENPATASRIATG
jgi:hypothetical protein